MPFGKTPMANETETLHFLFIIGEQPGYSRRFAGQLAVLDNDSTFYGNICMVLAR